MNAWVSFEFRLELVVWVLCDEQGGGTGGVGSVREGDCEWFEGWEGCVGGKCLFGGELKEDWFV